MTLQPLGEAAFLVRGLDGGSAAEWAKLVRSWSSPGVIEVVPAYDSLGIYVDPEAFDAAKFFNKFKVSLPMSGAPATRHTIPVCYSLGKDLDDICAKLSLTHQDFIAAHTGQTYACFAIGFCPGFPYLGSLSSPIAGLPRRSSPRSRVEPGTVAITGDQTGIYTLPRPGGWNLVGKTPLQLVNVAEGYFPISAGDEVIFVSIDEEDFEYLRGERL